VAGGEALEALRRWAKDHAVVVRGGRLEVLEVGERHDLGRVRDGGEAADPTTATALAATTAGLPVTVG
jgi:hypothetical protein